MFIIYVSILITIPDLCIIYIVIIYLTLALTVYNIDFKKLKYSENYFKNRNSTTTVTNYYQNVIKLICIYNYKMLSRKKSFAKLI